MLTRRVVTAVLSVLISGSAMAEFRPDPTALVKDLNMTSRSAERVTMVFWMPTEFWRASLESSGRVTPKEVDRFVKELQKYVVVAVADGQIGIAGSVNFELPELLRSSVTIENTRGELWSPLPEEDITGGVKNLTDMMRPLFANMLGAFGTHLAILVFRGTDKNDRPIVEPTKEGTFIVHVGKNAARYKLPLGSLLPPTMDAKTGERFPGNYHFNPYTGNKLSPAPDNVPAAPDAPAASDNSSDAAGKPAPVAPATAPVQQQGGQG